MTLPVIALWLIIAFVFAALWYGEDGGGFVAAFVKLIVCLFWPLLLLGVVVSYAIMLFVLWLMAKREALK